MQPTLYVDRDIMEEDLRHNKQRLACPFYNASLQGDSTCSEKCIVSFKDLAHVHEHLEKFHYQGGKKAVGYNDIPAAVQNQISELFKSKNRRMSLIDKWDQIFALCDFNLQEPPGPYFMDLSRTFEFLNNPPKLQINDANNMNQTRSLLRRTVYLASRGTPGENSQPSLAPPPTPPHQNFLTSDSLSSLSYSPNGATLSSLNTPEEPYLPEVDREDNPDHYYRSFEEAITYSDDSTPLEHQFEQQQHVPVSDFLYTLNVEGISWLGA